MPETTAEATCEHLISLRGGVATFCGRVAVSRYPAMGGGHMHQCIKHGKGHERYSEPCYFGPSESPDAR
jgi:hypothetical protein